MGSKKPTIAIVHYSAPPVVGGVEVVIEAHATRLIRAGYDVRLIVGSGGEVHPEIRTVVVPEMVAKGGPLSRQLKVLADGRVPPSFMAGVQRIEKKLSVALRGVDVCFVHNVLTMHFNLILTAALANIIASKRKTRFIGWIHDLSFADERYAQYCKESYPWNLMKTDLPGCDYCVISKQRQGFAHKIMGIPRRRLPIVPDGISIPGFLGLTPRVKEVLRENDLSSMDMVAVTPARLLPRKRIGFGVEIVAALKRRGKSVRWLVTGAPDVCNESDYEKHLLRLVKTLRVQKEVVFVGQKNGRPMWVSDQDVHSLYALSDILIFTSEQEGFGIPVLEAALARNLLVLTRLPVLKEITSQGTGCDVVWVPQKARRRRGTPLWTLGQKKADDVARQIITRLDNNKQFRFRRNTLRRYSWTRILKTKIEPMILRPEKLWN